LLVPDEIATSAEFLDGERPHVPAKSILYSLFDDAQGPATSALRAQDARLLHLMWMIA